MLRFRQLGGLIEKDMCVATQTRVGLANIVGMYKQLKERGRLLG